MGCQSPDWADLKVDRYLHARAKVNTTGIKPDGMHRMPLGLPQGIVTFMLGRRSITTGIKPNGMRLAHGFTSERARATRWKPVPVSEEPTEIPRVVEGRSAPRSRFGL